MLSSIEGVMNLAAASGEDLASTSENAMSGFLALMNAGEADINKLSTAIDNCSGTSEKMAASCRIIWQGS